MCARGASIPTLIVQEKRIQYPMKRAEGTERGAGQWERISWDEALTYVTDELKRVYAQYGQDAVICNGWRWGPRLRHVPGHWRRGVQHRVRVLRLLGLPNGSTGHVLPRRPPRPHDGAR